MRTEQQMSEIIQRMKVHDRKRQIAESSFKVESKYAIGISFTSDNERIKYAINNGRNFIKFRLLNK